MSPTDQPMNVVLMDQLGAIAFVFAGTVFVVMGLLALAEDLRIRNRVIQYTEDFIVLDGPPAIDVRACLKQRRADYLKEQRHATHIR